MKGNKTAEVIRLDAMACCVRLTGSGARAEKCRMVEAGRPDRIIAANDMVDESSLERRRGLEAAASGTLICFEDSTFCHEAHESRGASVTMLVIFLEKV